jgi:hypothetical protein
MRAGKEANDATGNRMKKKCPGGAENRSNPNDSAETIDSSRTKQT